MDTDDHAKHGLDSPTRQRTLDEVSGEPRWLGFNCVDADGCYLTAFTSDGAEQMLLAREQIEWLAAEGLPALLREMNNAR